MRKKNKKEIVSDIMEAADAFSQGLKGALSHLLGDGGGSQESRSESPACDAASSGKTTIGGNGEKCNCFECRSGRGEFMPKDIEKLTFKLLKMKMREIDLPVSEVVEAVCNGGRVLVRVSDVESSRWPKVQKGLMEGVLTSVVHADTDEVAFTLSDRVIEKIRNWRDKGKSSS